ncbi:MAG TPA: MG2 domain-containing protein [Nitrososphaera sp.]|nr:MG2 domain-containing protein [Nitrososphaera sp.]
MLDGKKMPIAVLVALNIALGAMFLPAAPVSAQSGSAEGSAQSQVSYKTAYPKASADSDSSVTVQSEHHLYRPGDTVVITGSVSSEVREEAQSDDVAVRVMDAEGTVVAEQQTQVDSSGEYSASVELPADAEGDYSTRSMLEVEASVLGLLSAEITAKLESSAAMFAVASSSSFDITAEGGEEFQVEIASNSTVDSVELDQEAKMVTFRVEGETGTRGVTQVTVPKAMLSGEMVVMIDGQAVSSESNDVIVTSETSAETTFEINYSHSERDVAVSGTNVVPEFPLAALVMAGAVGSIMAALAIAKKKGFGIRP